MRKLNKILIGLLCTVLFTGPFLASAGYDPNDIISDRHYYNANGMTESDIQNFLESYSSYLATYTISGRRASRIIYEACKSYGLNPKVMLVMLQKEQSLIETKSPTEDALKCAVGYGSCDPKYAGFDVQIDSAAWSLGVGYDQHKERYNYDVGKTTTTEDGVTVTPVNRATANLFIYNPVAGLTSHNGNYLFWTLWWNRYFGTSFPSGTLVRQKGTSGVYLVDSEGMKHGFWGNSAFSQTYRSAQVIEVDGSEIVGLGSGEPITLRDGVLFKAPSGAIFISQAGQRRGVPDRTTMKLLGYTTSDAVAVNQTEVNLLPEGEKFNKDNLNRPSGTFIKTADNPAVYLYEAEKRRPFWDKQILDFNYNGKIVVVTISSQEMNSYPLGPAVKFRDGALLQGPKGGIYVIANGRKYGIASREVFNGLGYKTSNVIKVRQALLDLHPDGGTIRTY